MQTLELNKMGLVHLSMEENISINAGGLPWKKIWDGTKWVVERVGIADFFAGVWDGITEGYTDARQ